MSSGSVLSFKMYRSLFPHVQSTGVSSGSQYRVISRGVKSSGGILGVESLRVMSRGGPHREMSCRGIVWWNSRVVK